MWFYSAFSLIRQQFLEICKITQNPSTEKIMRSTGLPLIQQRSHVLLMCSCKEILTVLLCTSQGSWRQQVAEKASSVFLLQIDQNQLCECLPMGSVLHLPTELGTHCSLAITLLPWGAPGGTYAKDSSSLCAVVLGIKEFISTGLLCWSWALHPPWWSTACSLTPTVSSWVFCLLSRSCWPGSVFHCPSFVLHLLGLPASSSSIFFQVRGELLTNSSNYF